MKEALRTLPAVLILTLAIWVWADREQIRPGEEPVPVQINLPAGTDYVAGRPAPPNVMVKYEGPSAQVARMRRNGKEWRAILNLSEAQLHTGPLELDAAEGFAHWADTRVKVLEVKPRQVTVRLDRVLRETVPIVPTVPNAELAAPPTAEPSEATVVVTESEWARVPKEQRFVRAVAPLPKDTGDETTFTLPATLERRLGGPSGIEITFEDPPEVKVSVRLKVSPPVPLTIPEVDVRVTSLPEDFNRYRVTFPEDTDRVVDVHVVGPRERLTGVTKESIQVILEILPTDKPQPEGISRRLRVQGLPPGVTLDPEKPLKSIRFNLEKIEDTP
jgi:hypothetical protein